MLAFSRTFALLLLLAGQLASNAQDDPYYVGTLKHKAPVLSIAFSPDAKYLASGGEDNLINVWDLSTGEVVATFEAYSQPVRSLAFSSDGRLLLSASGTRITLWNWRNGALKEFTGHKTLIWNVAFSADEHCILSTCLKNIFNIWDIETEEVLASPDGHKKSALAIAASGDGKYLASGSLDRNIVIWDYKSREALTTISAHGGNIYSLCFSPDSRNLVSASLDKTAKIWTVPDGKIVRILTGHAHAVMQANYSPGGTYIVTASWDRTARLWEASTGKSLYVFAGHDDVLNAAAFSPDTTLIATASNDGTIMLWKMSPGYIAEAYYWQEIQDDLEASGLTKGKDRAESRSDYKLRLEKAEEYKQELYRKYCDKHMEGPDREGN